MTTHTVTHHPVRSDLATVPATPASATTSTRWALAGLAAGVSGLGAIVSSSLVTAVYDQKASDTSDHLLGKFHDQVPQILAFHVLAVISAALMVVFAAGLFRRLRATAGPDSLVPGVAAVGVLATAVVLFIGAGLDTEFVFAFTDDEVYVDPSAATVYGHWIGTIPWCWGLLGLSGIALFVASRTRGVARWLGIVGLVGGGITLLFGISPLQYMAGFTGPLGLIVVALGFLVGDKAFRSR